MEWENKAKMVQLGNQRHNSDEAKKRVSKLRFRKC
jgi:hypothetical protein